MATCARPGMDHKGPFFRSPSAAPYPVELQDMK